jgi:hypothetical protein
MESQKFNNQELSRVFNLGIAHERLDIVFWDIVYRNKGRKPSGRRASIKHKVK